MAEVALALVLLIGSGLMIRSLWRLQTVDSGFDPSKLLTARLLLPGSKYGQDRSAAILAVIGKTIKLNGLPFTIVGVAPEYFRGTGWRR